MRLVEFKNPDQLAHGDEIDYSNLKLDKVEEFIRKNCSDYLAAMQRTKSLIYRGTENSSTIFYGHSRESRESISKFPKRVWDQINQYMLDAGYSAVRTNSIFAVSSDMMAMEFGSATVAIFPLNSSKFTCTLNYSDLPIALMSYFHNSWGPKEESFADMTPDAIERFLNKVEFDNTDFIAAIESGNEIMISGAYIGINTSMHKSSYDSINILLENLLDPNPPKSKINKNIITQITKDPYSIQYFPDASISEQLAAVSADGSAIQFIENPDVKVQLAAIKNDYTALSYIKNPNPQVIALAKKINNNAEYYTNKS